MLIGTADIDHLGTHAPTMDSLDTDSVTLEQVEILHVTYEIDAAAREALLPPALHPTNPPLVTWLFYRCPAGPLGCFTMAQTRIECRSGVRPRAFLMSSVVDDSSARTALCARWGFPSRAGTVELRRYYDSVAGTVSIDGHVILDVAIADPHPIDESDVQYVANMNPARTPAGFRLVQVDPSYRVHRAERGQPRLAHFDAAAWGDKRLRPVYPVSASIAVADVTLPRIRFVCRPDVWAFDGTEAVK